MIFEEVRSRLVCVDHENESALPIICPKYFCFKCKYNADRKFKENNRVKLREQYKKYYYRASEEQKERRKEYFREYNKKRRAAKLIKNSD